MIYPLPFTLHRRYGLLLILFLRTSSREQSSSWYKCSHKKIFTLQGKCWSHYKYSHCFCLLNYVYGKADCLVETLMSLVSLRWCLNQMNYFYNMITFTQFDRLSFELISVLIYLSCERCCWTYYKELACCFGTQNSLQLQKTAEGHTVFYAKLASPPSKPPPPCTFFI